MPSRPVSKILMILFMAALSLGSAGIARAQNADPTRIIQQMTALDVGTLQAGTTKITLWGITPPPAGSPLHLLALDYMDTLLASDTVNCKIFSGAVPDVVATCITQSNSDLGLELLNQGYAVVDRRQIAGGSAFAATYAKAQETVRLAEKGIWRLVAEEQRGNRIPTWLQPILPMLVPLALFLGPLTGLLITVFMMRYWLARMTSMQKEEREQANRKETVLSSRERYVLISTLEGELSENRNKVGAFILIYNDMLQTLKDPNVPPKYQKVGDIVQKRPALSKTVFEANLGKMSLLDMRLAGQLSKLYTSLPTGHEYINLDPNMPIETAIQAVEGALKEAETFIPGLDQAIQALEAAAAMKNPSAGSAHAA